MFTIKEFCIFCLCSVLYHSNFSSSDFVDDETGANSGQTNNEEETIASNVLSTRQMKNLAKIEETIYTEVKNYAYELQERINIMQAYLEDYEDSTLKGTESYYNLNATAKAHLVAEHPFMAYRMIRRFAKEFNAIVNHKRKKLEKKFIAKVDKIGELVQWPSEMDVEDASKTILRLQYVFNIHPKELFDGNYGGFSNSVNIPLTQGLELADVAFKSEFYTMAMQWMNFVQTEIENENNEHLSKGTQLRNINFNISQIAEKCNQIAIAHDKIYDTIENNSNLYIYDRPIRGSQNYRPLKEVNLEKYTVGQLINISQHESAHYNYISLCNGENLQTERVKSKLKCWLERDRNPYFAINPLKMELLSEDPYLVQIYECINDRWSNSIKNVSTPKLQSHSYKTKESRKHTYSYTYLEKEDIPDDLPLTRRLELITNLNLMSHGDKKSAPIMVTSYDFGGHISIHYDATESETYNEYFGKEEFQEHGDRAATVLFYLNTMEQGGQTVFPFIGTATRPEKGSVVYWHNLHRNGLLDLRSLHGACPVLLGHKWSVQHWVYQSENMLQRPCSLDPTM